MPIAATSPEATSAPSAAPRLAIVSITANTPDRAVIEVPRWRSVSPATSSSALPMPTTASARIARAGLGAMPMTASGAPQATSATANRPASRRPVPIASASTAPTIPPAPIAAPSAPTPGSPIPRTSIARIARNVVMRAADDGLDAERGHHDAGRDAADELAQPGDERHATDPRRGRDARRLGDGDPQRDDRGDDPRGCRERGGRGGA